MHRTKFPFLALPLFLSAVCVGAPIQWTGPGSNNHFYEPFNDQLSWSQANTLATSKGGYLVTILSQAEQNFVFANFGGMRRWLGLTDSGVEGTFAWITGEPLLYTNWAAGEPNNSNNGGNSIGEDFGELSSGGSWNDVPDVLSGRPFRLALVVEYGAPVPEPSTIILLSAGLAGIAFGKFRFRASS